VKPGANMPFCQQEPSPERRHPAREEALAAGGRRRASWSRSWSASLGTGRPSRATLGSAHYLYMV
jgi:hypothetical protein